MPASRIPSDGSGRWLAPRLGVLALVVLLAGCAAFPRMVAVPPTVVVPPAPPPAPPPRGPAIGDYPTALAAVTEAIRTELGLPVPAVILRVYADREAFEQGLRAELQYDPAFARETAAGAGGVAGADRILVNEQRLRLASWTERVQVLAHELTHAVQYALADGRRGASDQWLREGFADWVSYRVLERLGLDLFERRREQRVAQLREAARRGPILRLSDIVTFRDLVGLRARYPATATSALAFVAADLVVERAGLQAVLAYFRASARPVDRLALFRAAFGEDLADVEAALAARLVHLGITPD